MDFLKQFDSSEMAFNPPVRPPKAVNEQKFLKENRHIFKNKNLERLCKGTFETTVEEDGTLLDFYNAFE